MLDGWEGASFNLRPPFPSKDNSVTKALIQYIIAILPILVKIKATCLTVSIEKIFYKRKFGKSHYADLFCTNTAD